MKNPIKKIAILISFLLFVTFFNVNAQTTSENKKYNSVFWEISGNGLEKPSYLLGTLHLIPKADYVFTELMQEKFKGCKTLVLEADIDMSLKQQIEMVKKMMLPEGKTIDEYMTPEQFNEYKSIYLDTLKIKESTFNKIKKMKPIYGQLLILPEIIEKPKAYEKELSKSAKKNKMSVKGLETLDFQFQILESISIEEQIEMMFKDDNQNNNPIEEYNIMLNLYKEQNLDSLLILILKDDLMIKLEGKLLTDRNVDWIPKIEDIIKKQTAFIAVGAAHLPGEKGVISLLRAQGYSVKPIK